MPAAHPRELKFHALARPLCGDIHPHRLQCGSKVRKRSVVGDIEAAVAPYRNTAGIVFAHTTAMKRKDSSKSPTANAPGQVSMPPNADPDGSTLEPQDPKARQEKGNAGPEREPGFGQGASSSRQAPALDADYDPNATTH